MAKFTPRAQAEGNDDGLKEKMIAVNRVTKVVKGGRTLSFAALTVVGDGDGRVDLGRAGLGHARDRLAVGRAFQLVHQGHGLACRIVVQAQDDQVHAGQQLTLGGRVLASFRRNAHQFDGGHGNRAAGMARADYRPGHLHQP